MINTPMVRKDDDIMKIVDNIEQTREIISFWKKQGFSVGLVPTMGYLHEGHESLIERAVEENDKVVVSIFVNPMQFGPTEDLAAYPRDLEKDAQLCKEAGVNLVFHPEDAQMYQSDFSTFVDMTGLTDGLCGRTRPGHFRGVCTVVSKLFNIMNPDRAYFGQKDAQQLAVIQHMVQDLSMNIEVIACPIIREKDGLAKSSRNTYLNTEERKAAVVLSQALQSVKEQLEKGESSSKAISEHIIDLVSRQPLARIDYVEVVDWKNLQPIEIIQGKVLVAIAVYIGKTRLIDNLIF